MSAPPDLRTAALAYADAPGPATETGLELAAVRSTIDRVRETGEAFPPAAMVLLEQLAEDPCRCGTDRATCGCDRLRPDDPHAHPGQPPGAPDQPQREP